MSSGTDESVLSIDVSSIQRCPYRERFHCIHVSLFMCAYIHIYSTYTDSIVCYTVCVCVYIQCFELCVIIKRVQASCDKSAAKHNKQQIMRLINTSG